MALIETHNVTKRFGGLQAVSRMDFVLEQGRIVSIIGPNGAGKTTFFNLLTGEFKPDEGCILLDGRDIAPFGPDRRTRAGLARSFQRNNLFLEMSVRESLAMACAIRAGLAPIFWRTFANFAAIHRRAEEFANVVGLDGEFATLVRHLSYGSQRQLEVGLALACEPKVLLLDEPTSGMSPEETAKMQQTISSLPRSLTLIVIEHDMDVVAGLADRVVVLDHGCVLAMGTYQQISETPVVRERYLGESSIGAAERLA